MFTPLTFNKNQNIKVDRFDTQNYPAASTTVKKQGVGIPNSTYWAPGPGVADGTIVVTAYPNSDYIPATGGGEFKWMLWSTEAVNYSAWQQLYINTENGTQIGSGGNYSILGSSGALKGSFMVIIRERSGGGGNQDALLLLDSGSYYDWSDPQPVRIAYSYDRGSNTYKASLNGQTMTTTFENRSGYNIGTNKWITDIQPVQATNGAYTCGMFSQKISVRMVDSGSMGEWSYYSSSLSQDEMNVITNQPYGQPTNVLDKQPQVLYRFQEEQKETATGTSMPNDQLDGNTAYPNLGTLTDSSLAQAKTVGDSLRDITSGSLLNTQNGEYYAR